MELLLNIIWLFLAVPAVWIWRTEYPSRHAAVRFRSLRCLLILVSTLTLLFPIVSASDDLHAMRPEMEESSSSKRAVRVATPGKSPVRFSGALPTLALSPSLAAVYSNDQIAGNAVVNSFLLHNCIPCGLTFGRAPPISRLN
jgi:hypothetical protein